MGRGCRHLLAWVLPALTAACSGGGSERPDGGADAAVNPFGCEPVATGGDPFELLLGLDAEAGFEELHDGDACPVVKGGQGLLMIVVAYRAELPVSADDVCLDCLVRVTPTDAQEDIQQSGVVVFRANDAGSFDGSSIIVLGGTDVGEELDGKDASVSISCDGHGFSGAVERTVQLQLAPAA